MCGASNDLTKGIKHSKRQLYHVWILREGGHAHAQGKQGKRQYEIFEKVKNYFTQNLKTSLMVKFFKNATHNSLIF